MTISENIKHIRKIHKLNQEEFGARLGTVKSVISAYEIGKRTPNLEIVVKLSQEFDISVDDLLFTDLSKQSPKSKDPRMQKTAFEYAQDIENMKTSAEALEQAIGEDNLKLVLRVLTLRVKDLERVIKESDPELAKRHGIE